MNVPIDVITTFNTKGEIRPDYIRLEDEEHVLRTYRIEEMEYSEEKKYAGVAAVFFLCYIMVRGIRQQIRLYYNLEKHKWFLIQ